MAVYTQLSDHEISGFLARYEVDALASAKGIAEGIENTNYLLTTARGEKYILTVYEQRVRAEDVPFYLELTEWMAQRGIPCPRPIRGKDGKAFYTLKGKTAALIEFLEGKGSPNVINYHIEQLGALIARMHLAAQDFPKRRDNALSLEGWQELFKKIGKKADTIAPGLHKVIADELAFLQKHWPKDLPSGVVHADIFPDNVFFQNDRLTGVIDFYFSCNDFWMYDLLIALNAWCFNGAQQFNAGRAKLLLQAYHAVRPITAEERVAIPVLARGAALRFLLTRSHDWLNRVDGALVTPKDPMEYAAKLAFHQQNNPLAPL